MGGIRFDELARSLTTAGSRRRALGGLLLGSLGLLGREGVEDAEAHDPSKKCKKTSGKAKKKCLKKAKAHTATHVTQTPPSCTPNCGGKTCGPDGCGNSCGPCTNGTCPGGTCLCPSGTKNCGGACSDTMRDPRNCSDCGVRCNINEYCVEGLCRCVSSERIFNCPPGFTCCPNGDCTCRSIDPLNPSTCASAGASCPPGSTPCVATSNTCAGGGPSQVCCPSGTTCLEDGTCQLQ